MLSNVAKRIRNLKLSTKFIGAMSIVLLVMTVLDINYNAEKSHKITHAAVKEWTFLFAENVRVSLNTLMRKGEMDIRFALFKAMQEELSDLEDVRVIRSKLTNDIFMEVNRREIIPPLMETKNLYEKQITEIKTTLDTTQDADERDELQEQLDDLGDSIEEINEQIDEASAFIAIDPREQARDELDEQVLSTGKSIYMFEGDSARVLIPYVAKEKGCSENDGCHTYAKPGDVLGAISLEFSLASINQQISDNNIEMAGTWLLRFITLMVVITGLLSLIITGNINKMLGVFSRVSKGDFSVRATIDSEDEIGKLADGFNKMASSLEETKAALDKRLLEIYALYNVSKTLNASFETDQLLIRLIDDISKDMDIDRMLILIPDKNFTQLTVASHTGFTEEEVCSIRPNIHEGIYSLVAFAGICRLIEDIDTDVTITKQDIFSPDIGSLVIVPFLRRGKVMGLICAFRDRPNKFAFSDLNLFNSVAEHLAIALENARLFEKTKMMAITDGLTELFNKRYLIDVLDTEIARAARCEHDLSFLIMDIDNFKHYNDTNGHPAGDTLLKELAFLITSSIRKIDIPCRYGGEEFVVVLPETSKTNAKIVADKLLKKIASHPFAHAEAQPLGCISVSMGLAAYPYDATDDDGLVYAADTAMYGAKTSGKNKVVLS
ncbi:diguanylate cyclase (GGDEF domain) [hydrothermal vent metagenome]|uniref:Diguanylate cyclase (GGDEF domain) n=1 Tax=hydrothermal vent metagenome TaxID=652676 RepID=A0A3B1BLU8_9ZZZZ